MTTQKHSPGPWKESGTLVVNSTKDALIAVTTSRGHGMVWQCDSPASFEALANAKLIATAPALLQFARDVAGECDDCGGTGKLGGEHGFEETCETCIDVRNLIREATLSM